LPWGRWCFGYAHGIIGADWHAFQFNNGSCFP